MTASRSNLIILVLVTLSTLGTVFTLFFGEKYSSHESYRNDVYSYSALGHRVFYEVLQSKYPDVEISQESEQRYNYLFIIEPDLEYQEDEFQERVGQCLTCILVLPKRVGFPNEKGNHISRYEFVETNKVDSVLRQFLLNSDGMHLERVQSYAADLNQHGLPLPEIPADVQLVKGVPKDRIIFGSQDGALVFWESVYDSKKIVISDPDILANHGIDEEANFQFIGSLLNAELGPQAYSVGVDETLHGYRQTPSLLRLLTTFPLSIFTIQLLFILLFVTWRGLIVFGRPNMEPRSLELGTKTLIENTASLFSPNHAGYLGRQYTKAAMKDVADRLNAPRQLSHEELIIWLDEQTAARGFSFRISEALERWDDFDMGIKQWKSKDTVTIAQQVDQWRNRMSKE